MISKQKRLTTSRVAYVLKKGSRFGSSRFFGVRFVPTSRNENRFCAIVSLKIAEKAVERNRLRRIIYDIAGSTVTGEKKLDIILIARPSIKEARPEDLKQDIEHLIKNIDEKK